MNILLWGINQLLNTGNIVRSLLKATPGIQLKIINKLTSEYFFNERYQYRTVLYKSRKQGIWDIDILRI
jgi:hypothetical protein